MRAPKARLNACEMLALLPPLATAVLVYMTAWFLLALLRRDNSLADVAWGGGFILVALLALVRGAGPQPRSLLVTALVVAWGVRLAVHIAVRNRGRGEDFRYAAWRREWGRFFVVRSFLQVFVLQGALLLVIAAGIVVINARPGPSLGVLDAAGIALWVVGFVFEMVGDWQLLRFTRDPANRGLVMDRGLWRFSRHPNYFGEAAMWWGIAVIALSAPEGWIGLISPIAITFLLLRVSGVPMLEKGLRERVPGYAEYAERTSAFIPWLPARRA